MRVKFLVGIAAFTIGLNAANAADAPAPVEEFSWRGFYIGTNLGYGVGGGTGVLTINGFGSSPVSGNSSGILGGGQVGYNIQAGPAVIGFEADFQGGESRSTLNAATSTGWAMTAVQKSPWFGTVRGRLGYAFDRTMIFGTAGLTYGESQLSGTTTASGAFSASTIDWSWTFGGGLEHMFLPNWSAKIEYLYSGNSNNPPLPPLTSGLTGSVHRNIVRAGINYHF